MRKHHGLTVCVAAAAVTVWGLMSSVGRPEKREAGADGLLELPGRTQAVPNRKATISNVPLHPVDKVVAQIGDRVKKGQVLIELDADEPKADVRNKEAVLQAAIITRKEAERSRYGRKVPELAVRAEMFRSPDAGEEGGGR